MFDVESSCFASMVLVCLCDCSRFDVESSCFASMVLVCLCDCSRFDVEQIGDDNSRSSCFASIALVCLCFLQALVARFLEVRVFLLQT